MKWLFRSNLIFISGGWLFISNVVIDGSPVIPWSAEKSYRGISNYQNNRMGITRTALKDLRTHLHFTQLRFHCNKQQGRTFHVITAANSSGEAVVQYFSGQTNVQPDACGSFVRMKDDNSYLAMHCDRWGYNGSSFLVGKWAFSVHERMMHSHPAFIGGAGHWVALAEELDGKVRAECDDTPYTKGGLFNLSAGDFWRIYVR